MEIASGLHRIQALKQLARFHAMLAGCEVLDLRQPAALLAGKIDADLRRRGTTIDLNDAIIAAIALEAGLPVVTGNAAHFEAIANAGYKLEIQNWRIV